MHEPMRQLAVVGEQQEPGRIHIEPSDHDPAPAARGRQALEHGGPILGIGARGHLAYRLVINEHFDGLAPPAEIQGPPIETDPVGDGGTVAQHRDAVVDGHAAGADPLLDAAARAMARAG
jgi:hypothetical protein